MKKQILITMLLLMTQLAIAQQEKEIDYDSYKTTWAWGIELAGGGLLGVIGKYEIAPNLFAEGGLHYRPVVITDGDEFEFKRSLLLTGGINYFTSRKYKAHKDKVKFNGLFLKAGHGFSSFNENILAIGWVNEGFRKGQKNKSVQFELGPGLLHSPWVDDFDKYYYRNEVEKFAFMVLWKVSWNFYQ